jgi:hypothetical protein
MKRLRTLAYKEQQKARSRERYSSDSAYREKKNKRTMAYHDRTKIVGDRYHGLTGTGAWRSWKSMRSRVLCASSFGHEAYRKLTIDRRWDSFANFYADMGDRPSGMTLDRKDNNIGYCKSNCRWATTGQQARNKTTNKLTPSMVAEIKAKIGKYSYPEIAKSYGVHPTTICDIVKGRTWVEEVANV